MPYENIVPCKVITKGYYLDQLLLQHNSIILVQHMDSNIVFVGQLVNNPVNKAEEQGSFRVVHVQIENSVHHIDDSVHVWSQEC